MKLALPPSLCSGGCARCLCGASSARHLPALPGRECDQAALPLPGGAGGAGGAGHLAEGAPRRQQGPDHHCPLQGRPHRWAAAGAS